MASPIEILLCYAHEDDALRKELAKHIRVLQRLGIINFWHDRNISGGKDWELEIDKHLNGAQIILLLISPDFIDSEYCYGIEMRRALERHEFKEARVIPIILRHAYWRVTPFGKLQALPTDGKPIIDRSWHSQDEAFLNVVEGINKVVEELVVQSSINSMFQKKPTPELEEQREGDRFTTQARNLLSFAQEEAERLQHNYIGTEHLLLGLLREKNALAIKVLDNCGINPNKVASATEFIITYKVSGVSRSDRLSSSKEIGLTPRAKKVIELSLDEARRMNHSYIGTEHILLGLVREGEGVAAGTLESLGLDLTKARKETIKLHEQQ